MVNVFEILVSKGHIKLKDSLLENSFMVLFWRRNKWYGAKNYPKILRSLFTLGYDEHPEFWSDFLKPIPNMT